ncbi:hypothetical protein GCM10025770_20370 [Viridibacterium curvum]|uniref:Lipoprotein n=2 Tax=Viridibacterium curvum TaxID=1101404 RepID=A0ABP9QPI3_9RHOO
MQLIQNRSRLNIRALLNAGLVVATVVLTGCVSPTFYVDTATREVPVAELKKPAQPKAVQLLFDFQTKGAPNSRAVSFLKDQVVDQVKGSGLFATVDEKPVPGGAVLNVTINNIPEADAAAKGFKVGLTFGASGTKVTDNYVCTVTYLPPDGGKSIVKVSQHAIHTTIGATEVPQNVNKAESVEVAVRTMTRQIIGTALKDLSLDPTFP